MSISNPEIKKLYGLSAGRCSICKIDLFENEVHIGQMAHVIAKSVNGPRGNEELNYDRNSYENLILLCSNHHLQVDQNPKAYPVDKLRQLKREHEQTIASCFDAPTDRKNDIDCLNLFMKYVPFISLQYFIEYLPYSVNLDFTLVGDMFEALCKDNPHLYPFNDPILDEKFRNFIEGYYQLWNKIGGYTVVDGREQANADNHFNIHMEKKYLPYEAVTRLHQEIEQLKNNFLTKYFELIVYLRGNYKNVQLSTYVKQRWG